ncbi:hypothetical protein GCM10022631_08590 [Deinococcus rubellus]
MDVPGRGLSMRDQLCQGQDRQRLTGVPGFTQIHRRTPSEYETQGDKANEEEDAAKLGGGLLHVSEFKTDKLLLSQPNTPRTPSRREPKLEHGYERNLEDRPGHRPHRRYRSL